VVHAHTISTALAAKILKPLVGYNLVTSVHNGPRRRNLLLAVGDSVICVSAAVAEGLKKLPLTNRKLRIVRNGPLGSPRKSGSPKLDAAVSEPAILTMAGLHAHKGVDDLIEAFAVARRSIPELSMYILGEGPERHRLETHADRLACGDRIHFKGFVSDPRSYLAKADVFVLPSHMEAFGLSIAEAREAGCAVIGMKIGGIPEVLEDGRRGILLPKKNPSELARVIVELFSDEGLLQLWQDRASSNLSWLHVDRVCQETLSIYSELIGSTHRQAAASKAITLIR
jgi:glycosyltransferase involved in cell wall biosynthesis